MYLGLSGIHGNDARRAIPGLLLQCPGFLLLHDPIYVPADLFDVEDEETLEHPQYLLATTLVNEGVLRIAPEVDATLEETLQEEVTELAVALLRHFGCEAARDAVAGWSRHGGTDLLARACPKEKRKRVDAFAELLVEVCRAQGLAEHLRCPYAFPVEDEAVASLRWSLVERSVEEQVHAVLRIPIPTGTLLVSDEDDPTAILPDFVFSARKAMQGSILFEDESGAWVPYVEPSWERSRDRVHWTLQAREDGACVALRELLASWYKAAHQDGVPDPGALQATCDHYQEQVTAAFRDLGPLYEELVATLDGLGINEMHSVPNEIPLLRREGGTPGGRLRPVFSLTHAEYFGPTGNWSFPRIRLRRG